MTTRCPSGWSRAIAGRRPGRRPGIGWQVPGTSEHQLGLAVDIVDVNYQLLDTNQENTAVQKWLLENSWRYGFILRYPTDQTDVTGIVYEPWHYRYVGKEYAQDYLQEGSLPGAVSGAMGKVRHWLMRQEWKKQWTNTYDRFRYQIQ